ncbi:ABC-F family ATP-binding cassette domain-containing protein [Pedobacter rhizosphaerae]|uniref:ATPase components of ABC transporters with duplicated ATPase domains n=1 Tax=Pedobacter rhizosphaerae TaxID=390241 RepID=A0A1H9SJW0_9SPHI|nr:ABC-F family ATP-binding cassette domain-containing protein [Pedobacter rhizosphaerae]SER85262.1 ATPase components of ABC transporters with duplicated ATPase domains [Pedobacter rhizosphaerae]
MSITIKSLSYIHPDNEALFLDLNLNLNSGEKAALVGINGVGKSTLLQMIAGNIRPTSGEISFNEKPWYVPQHLGEYDKLTIANALRVDKKLVALRAILDGSAETQYFTDLDDDWEIEKKVETALQKWGLENFSLDEKMGNLSGGQKTKVFLAALDLHDPELILLDEPSNHLDARSRKKLYNFILQRKATMLVVSHDKLLLNLMNKTLELSKKGIAVFGGNFEFYQQQKEEKVNALQAQLSEQAKTLKQTEKKAREVAYKRQLQESRGKSAGQGNSMPRIIAGGLKSKSERSTAKIIDAHHDKISGLAETMRETKSQILQYQVLKINIAASDLHPGKVLAEAENINFAYRSKPLWNNLSFQIRSGDRVHIEGENGAGKTTLLKIITQQLQALEGHFSSADFSYLYLDQDYTLIDPELTIYDQVQYFNTGGLQEHEIKALLIYSQFDAASFDRKCDGLSGGEKMKLSLCCLSVSNRAPDILILDEPTNNLDVQSLEILSSAIKEFEGTLLVISHDGYFINEIGINKRITLS